VNVSSVPKNNHGMLFAEFQDYDSADKHNYSHLQPC